MGGREVNLNGGSGGQLKWGVWGSKPLNARIKGVSHFYSSYFSLPLCR